VSEQSKTFPRLVNLQILRAVAATLAVWAHAIDVSLLPGTGKPILATGYLENFGAFGVDIFFVISGFIISTAAQRADRSWLQFAKDRFIRVAPIFYVLSVPWILRAANFPDFSIFSPPLVPTFFFWPVVGGRFVEPYLSVGWTLSFEALFYTAMTASMFFRKWISRPALTTVGFFLVAICMRLIFATPVLSFLGNPIILEFLFGIAVGWVFAWTGTNARLAIVIAALVALALGYELIYGFGDISESHFIEDGTLSFTRAMIWGLPATGIVFIALLTEDQPGRAGPLKRFLAFLGDASYSLYLVHLLVMTAFKLLQARGIVSGDALIVLSIACSLLAGSLSYLFIETPLTRVIKRFSRTRTLYKTPAPSSPT
jgi:exopolysaccharide production protein ExoZ